MTHAPSRSASATRTRIRNVRPSPRAKAAAATIERMVGNSVHRAVSAAENAVQQRIHEQGSKYLEDAVKQSHKAMGSVMKWGKKNPVKAAAAATALVGASAFLYAFMKKKSRAS